MRTFVAVRIYGALIMGATLAHGQPCTNCIQLTPQSATNLVGTTHTVCATVFGASTSGITNSLLVPGTANIFSAGLAAPVAPAGGGAGTLPVQFSVGPGQTAFQFKWLD